MLQTFMRQEGHFSRKSFTPMLLVRCLEDYIGIVGNRWGTFIHVRCKMNGLLQLMTMYTCTYGRTYDFIHSRTR